MSSNASIRAQCYHSPLAVFGKKFDSDYWISILFTPKTHDKVNVYELVKRKVQNTQNEVKAVFGKKFNRGYWISILFAPKTHHKVNVYKLVKRKVQNTQNEVKAVNNLETENKSYLHNMMIS